MEELLLAADTDNLYLALDFMDAMLDERGCDPSIKATMDIALEEMFVNIAHYAYPEGETGTALLRCGIAGEPPSITVELSDGGRAFDPLARPDPDVTKPLHARRIGGLGIYMVKKTMDSVQYRREDEKNIFTMTKRIHK